MKSFRAYLNDTLINEGGNCPFINRETGEVLGSADRVDMSKVDRKKLQGQLITLFRTLDTKFKAKNKRPIWDNFDNVTSGKAFNGSSEHFFDDEISDEEFREEKKSMGDVDITIPHKYLKPLFELLADHENQRLTKDFVYLGQNQKTQVRHQINAVFQLQDPKINVQIDFEGTGYTDKGDPDEFAKFSHSSNWEDVRAGIKGLGHKHLLVNVARALSELKNAVVLTPSSPVEPPEAIKISNSASARMPTNLAFSVDLGVRVKYEPVKNSKLAVIPANTMETFREKNSELIHNFKGIENHVVFRKMFEATKGHKNEKVVFDEKALKDMISAREIKELEGRYKNLYGELVKVNGKQVFRELSTNDSKYEKNIPAIYTMIFNRKPDDDGKDLSEFRSFSGILRLFKKHNTDKRLIENVFRLMIDKSFFGRGAQGTDATSPDRDRETKMAIVNKMIEEFPYLKTILDSKKELIKTYYKNYKTVEKRN